MKQRGRKSALKSVEFPPTPVAPPANLSEPAKQAFYDLVASCEPEHFTNSDIGLISVYVNAQVLVDKALKDLEQTPNDKDALKLWETSAKIMSNFAMRLRIGPQSRRQYAKVDRPMDWSEQFRARQAQSQKKPWEWEP